MTIQLITLIQLFRWLILTMMMVNDHWPNSINENYSKLQWYHPISQMTIVNGDFLQCFYKALVMIIIQSKAQIQTLAKVVLWKMLQIAESNLTKVRRDEENNESEWRKGKLFILKINNWGEKCNNYLKTNYWICSTKVRLGSFLLLFVILFWAGGI